MAGSAAETSPPSKQAQSRVGFSAPSGGQPPASAVSTGRHLVTLLTPANVDAPAMKRIESLGVRWLLGLAELRAGSEREGEHRISAGESAEPREDEAEVVFKEVLEEARRDSTAEILTRALAPARDKGPDLLWIRLDEVGDLDESLPPRIGFVLGRWLARQQSFRGSNGKIDGWQGVTHVQSRPAT